MNLFLILLLCALIAAGYYVYRRLLKIEREIRGDQVTTAAEDAKPSLVTEAEPSKAEAEPSTVDPLPEPVAHDVAPEGVGLREQIELAIAARPGLAQTELYGKFPDVERRELQKLLRELDQSGELRREKKGSSYLLYPL